MPIALNKADRLVAHVVKQLRLYVVPWRVDVPSVELDRLVVKHARRVLLQHGPSHRPFHEGLFVN